MNKKKYESPVIEVFQLEESTSVMAGSSLYITDEVISSDVQQRKSGRSADWSAYSDWDNY